ncbi:AAA family ATPase [Lichenifustis flavocetrariae]|uniref:AAA family ATPase n=1 Tax=Lichenifustis flavocetrariae TaxID=2949735 RepID=A0AA41Z9R7_9HYPH|nr:AAA family ATPase [Lichenifustis flavocetrariae]MCW6513103.1 AAA family ATPase [Lichenifustis flavocetrariae]
MMAERTTKRRQRRITVEEIEEVERIRMSTLDPLGETDGIEEVPAPSPRLLPLQSAYSFGLEWKPPDFIVEPFLCSGTLFGLTAGTGTGKTGLMLSLALAVASGRSEVLGLPSRKGRVVFVTIENPAHVRGRMVVTARFFDIRIGKLGNQFIIIRGRCSPEDLLFSLQQVTLHGHEISLVIIDGFSAMFDGKDLNSGVEGGEFLRRLRPITELRGAPAVLVAMHPGKGAGNDELVPVGSGMLLNELDANLVLRRNSVEKCVDLHWAGKIRGLDFAPISFVHELATSPLILDSEDRPIQMPVMRRHVPSKPSPVALTDTRPASPPALLKAMITHPEGPQRTWAADVGCSQAMVGKHLKRLEQDHFAASEKGHWTITEKGREEAQKWA